MNRLSRVISLIITLTITVMSCGGDNPNVTSVTSQTSTGEESTGTPTESPDPSNTTTIYVPGNTIRVAAGEGGFDAALDSGDRFGRDHDSAGDINGDGIIDLVIGARSDDDGATDAGAVYILFMNADGTVGSQQKISALAGGFTDTLVSGSFFGYGVAGIGDYDGDNIPDIAVSAPSAANQAIYILHLAADGTVKSMTKTAGINAQGLSAMGDLNGDGRIDLIAANPGAADGGAIRILFFNGESRLNVEETVTISATDGGFGDGLQAGDQFGGRESAFLGDIDSDGTVEIAVGAFQSDGGTGAIWILSLDPISFNVLSKQKIAAGLAGFNESISTDVNTNGTSGGHFGHAMAAVGDLNGDGVTDLVTGANQYNEGYGYILYLNPDKTVKTFTRINGTEGGFDLTLDDSERFSRSISYVGDTNGDGLKTINMGGGAGGTGAVYRLQLESCSLEQQEGNKFWSEGVTFFSNWNHTQQLVTGPLSLEQCTLVMAENSASHMTHSNVDGRCIVKDEGATLTESEEGSQAYIRSCP